jgi:molybdate transport system substrate-binding protein
MPNPMKVLATTALKTSFEELSPEFERASGYKLALSFGPSTRIAKQVADGEPNDVTIVTAEGIEDLTKQGRIVAGSRTDLARSAMGLAVQKGAPRPDISTAEKFKQAMLNAKSLGMSNPVGGGASGAILAAVFERLGIADAMKPKLVFGPGGPAGLIGNFLVRKEVEIGIQQIPELMAVPGIDIVGPLPPGIQSVSVFSAGLSSAAQEPEGGRALIKFLASPAAAKVIRDKGMETP